MLTLLTVALVAGCGGGGGDSSGIASLAQGRWGHTATLLEDGRVLVVGGQESQTVAITAAEIYDPSTGTWSSAGSTRIKRGEGHTVTLLNDGTVLVVGDDEEVEIYDPSTKSWSTTGSMSTERVWHSATLLNDGRVLVTGGLAGRLALDTAEIYDPSTGEWSLIENMSEQLDHPGAVLLPDGKVLVVGKYLDIDLSIKFAVDIYDPSTDTWSPTERPSTRERFFGFPMTLLEDGRIMIPGGTWSRGGYGATYVAMQEVDIFDPATGTWSEAAALNEGRRSHQATRLEDGTVLVMGERSTEIYDPATGIWTDAGEMNTSRIERFTATMLQDGTVLVVGGRKDSKRNFLAVWEGGEGRTEAEIYDPATGW